MSGDTHTVYNVPGKIVGWWEEVGAKIEMMVSIPDAHVHSGQVFNVTLRYDPKKLDQHQITFLTLNKRGLRVGGVVLLRKMTIDENGVVTAKDADILIESPRYGHSYLSPNAAVSLLPPPENSRMVTEGYVAMLNQAMKVSKVDDALKEIVLSLELARSFGLPGLVLTGEEADGAASELVVIGDGDIDSEGIATTMKASLDAALIRHINKKKSWYLVPIFKTEIDPDRASRISGQAANVDYGDDDELSWTVCNCVLRNPGTTAGSGWMINDTTPMFEDGAKPEMLLNIIEQSIR